MDSDSARSAADDLRDSLARPDARLAAAVLGVDPGAATGYCAVAVFALPEKQRTAGEVAAVAGGRETALLVHPLLGKLALLLGPAGTARGLCETVWTLGLLLEQMRRGELVPHLPPAPVWVACERYVVTGRSGNARDHLLVEGAVHALCCAPGGDLAPVRLDDTQKSARAKPIVTDQVLRELGMRRRGVAREDHEYDAMRHAVLRAMRLSEQQSR